MKQLALSIVVLLLFAPCDAMSVNDEAQVRAAIQVFHKAFDDGITGPADYYCVAPSLAAHGNPTRSAPRR